MNNELDNIDDLFDDNIGKSLRQLGFNFPRTFADFKKIEALVEKKQEELPEKLKDPYKFLSKRNFSCETTSLADKEQQEYSSNLAQAAREGKVISDEIKAKMVQDKSQSIQKKNDD